MMLSKTVALTVVLFLWTLKKNIVKVVIQYAKNKVKV